MEKIKNLQEKKSLPRKKRLKEKLGKQDFHDDMEEVFEPVTAKQAEATENQKHLSEKQIQALHDSPLAIQESSNTLHDNIQKSIKQGIQDYDESTNRNKQLLTSLVNSNQVDSDIVKTVSNPLIDKKSQFSLEPITQSNPKLFTINPSNPQPVLIKGSTMTFQNEHS